MAHNLLLAYPDFNGGFKIHSNARNFQLGAAITQNENPVALYITKLNYSQNSYT